MRYRKKITLEVRNEEPDKKRRFTPASGFEIVSKRLNDECLNDECRVNTSVLLAAIRHSPFKHSSFNYGQVNPFHSCHATRSLRRVIRSRDERAHAHDP